MTYPVNPTRAVILAAGKGTRLGSVTADIPKVLLDIGGQTLLWHQRRTLASKDISEVHIVLGHGASVVRKHPDAQGLTIWENPRFAATNMVSTLLCASSVLDGRTDVLISYGDIVYESPVVRALQSSNMPIAVVVDLDWRRYWDARMENPLEDAETLKISPSGLITEIGNPPLGYDDIDAQFIGLIGIKAGLVQTIRRIATTLVQANPNAFMTTLLQHAIQLGLTVAAVPIRNQWLEFDSPLDLSLTHAGFWHPEVGESALPSA